MKEQSLTIPIDKIKADFQLFLTPEHNRRIIFSGPFGIGKTYFLNEFFHEKTEYFPIFLRPINYSLLSNEDVFKFIKYDILAQLITKEKINIDEDIKVSTSDGLKSFLKNNKLLVLKNLLKVIPKLGGFSDSIEEVEELYLKYRESKEKLSKELSGEQVKIFNEDFEEHFLSEFDNVSSIIKQVILEEKLKSVLIIDDMDRLDPEHIFRLFNVFSAHFDIVNDNSNKFGFDKIIFVCDIENIRKIFAHKYGATLEYSGYIDKFYSSRPFYMSNLDEVSLFILNSLKFHGVPDDVNEIMRFFLAALYVAKRINLRKILKVIEEPCVQLNYDDNEKISLNHKVKIHGKYINWISYFGILKNLFGNYGSLIDELNSLEVHHYPLVERERYKLILDRFFLASPLIKEEELSSVFNKGNSVNGDRLNNVPIKSVFKLEYYYPVFSAQASNFQYTIYEVYASGDGNNLIVTSQLGIDMKEYLIELIKKGIRIKCLSI